MHTIFRLLYQYINRLHFMRQHIFISRGAVFNGILFVRNFGKINIGENFKATSGKRFNPIGGDTVLRLVCLKGASIVIGDNVGISNSTFFITSALNIGNNVLFGGGCKVWDSDFHSIDVNIRVYGNDDNVRSLPVKIMDNAFIGGGSTILKGVTVGRNSIVGAGSVVTKSIPDNEVWAGNPAKKIKSLLVYE